MAGIGVQIGSDGRVQLPPEPPGYRPRPRARVPLERIGVIGGTVGWRDVPTRTEPEGARLPAGRLGMVLTRYADGDWGSLAGWEPVDDLRAWQRQCGLSRITGTWPVGQIVAIGSRAGAWWTEAGQ